jgi:hypothetical protein
MITCAAIKLGDKIYIGGRHHIIFRAYPEIDLRPGEQGFVDATGKFYTRCEALAEAIACNQIWKERAVKHNELYSEDVW